MQHGLDCEKTGFPDARLEVYDGAGHALFGSTEDLAKRILTFLSKCEERERGC